MSLHEWLKSGWLKEHRTSRQEIGELLGVADRDLLACQTPGLIADWRLAIAYNAALQVATAALAASGYEASRIAHHVRVINSLAFTLGLGDAEISMFDTFRKKRNEADYERAGSISDTEADEMIAFAQKLRDEVDEWIRAHYPGLSP